MLPSVLPPVTTAARRPDARGWGLIAGPVAFISAWVVSGRGMGAAYSPVIDAISRTAAVGAPTPTRPLMTAGFVVYAACAAVGARALADNGARASGLALGVNAAATVGVALTPLDSSAAVDSLHALAATTGYVSLALTPLLAAGPLSAAGHRRAALASRATGAVVGACLALTVASDSISGLMQRAGLTAGDAWLITAGAALVLGRWPLTAQPGAPRTGVGGERSPRI